MSSHSRIWNQAAKVSEAALTRGVLQPISTASHCIEEVGIPFVVRVAPNLHRKQASAKKQAVSHNPFLPYDERLHVADLGSTHVLLLNKFNVFDQHLLIVTRDFQHQEEPLTSEDFRALASCLREAPALAFYNSGKIAGASQNHKHMQLIPQPNFPLTALSWPIVPRKPVSLSNVPFTHRIIAWDDDVDLSSGYGRLLEALHLHVVEGRVDQPYNLLVTREWMMLVPRAREDYQSIACNALGFAGYFLVRSEEAVAQVRQIGPARILRALTC